MLSTSGQRPRINQILAFSGDIDFAYNDCLSSHFEISIFKMVMVFPRSILVTSPGEYISGSCGLEMPFKRPVACLRDH